MIEVRLARYVASLEFDAIPDSQVAAAKILVEDVIACLVSGLKSRECERILQEWHTGHELGEASFVGTEMRGAWSDACFVHAVFAHWFEWDDSYDAGALHASAVIFPVLLAAAEKGQSLGRRTDGREFLCAFVAALEVTARLGHVLAPYAATGLMPTGFASTVGASAGAARLLGLSQSGIMNAMAISSSGVALSRQAIVDFVDGKNVLCGMAASRAAEAVRLASCGITGAPGFLSGRFGMAELIAGGDAHLEEICSDLGKLYHIDKISLKPYPSCRLTHAAVDLTLEIQADLSLHPTDIVRIEVLVAKPMADLCGAPFRMGTNPRVTAQFSLAYTVACAMVKCDLDVNHFMGKAIREDEEVLRMSAKVVTLPQPLARGLRALEQPVTVRVARTDGSLIVRTTHAIKGSPQKPMSRAERLRKFEVATGDALTGEDVAELRAAIQGLESGGPLPIAGVLRKAKVLATS